MIGKIAVQNCERCYPKRLKRFFQSDLNYKTYSSFVPNVEHAVIGNIPIEVIKLFEPKERGQKIKLFQSALSNFAQLSRTERDFNKVKEALNNNLKEVLPEGFQTELEENNA